MLLKKSPETLKLHLKSSIVISDIYIYYGDNCTLMSLVLNKATKSRQL